MDRVDLLGESGAVYKIEYNGKTYKMSRLTGKLKAEWEMFLRKRHLNSLLEMREVMPPEKYDAEIEAYKQLVEERYFAIESEHSQKVMNTPEGGLVLVRLCFSQYHPDLSDTEFLDLMMDNDQEIQTGFNVIHATDIKRAENLKKKSMMTT